MGYLSLANKYSIDYVKRVQNELKHLGFYRGAIDGIYGLGTWNAVRRFQEVNNLLPDGDAGTNTLKVLFPNIRPDVSFNSEVDRSFDYPHDDTFELNRFYGKPGRDVESQLKSYRTPYPLYYAGQRVKSIRLHQRCADSFLSLFEDIQSVYSDIDIAHLGLNLYGGSYAHRFMRGARRWSTHAYGCAIDLDPAHNALRMDHRSARFASPDYADFWDMVAVNGLYSLGVHHDYDWMHIQAAFR